MVPLGAQRARLEHELQPHAHCRMPYWEKLGQLAEASTWRRRLATRAGQKRRRAGIVQTCGAPH